MLKAEALSQTVFKITYHTMGFTEPQPLCFLLTESACHYQSAHHFQLGWKCCVMFILIRNNFECSCVCRDFSVVLLHVVVVFSWRVHPDPTQSMGLNRDLPLVMLFVYSLTQSHHMCLCKLFTCHILWVLFFFF